MQGAEQARPKGLVKVSTASLQGVPFMSDQGSRCASLPWS